MNEKNFVEDYLELRELDLEDLKKASRGIYTCGYCETEFGTEETWVCTITAKGNYDFCSHKCAALWHIQQHIEHP